MTLSTGPAITGDSQNELCILVCFAAWTCTISGFAILATMRQRQHRFIRPCTRKPLVRRIKPKASSSTAPSTGQLHHPLRPGSDPLMVWPTTGSLTMGSPSSENLKSFPSVVWYETVHGTQKIGPTFSYIFYIRFGGVNNRMRLSRRDANRATPYNAHLSQNVRSESFRTIVGNDSAAELESSGLLQLRRKALHFQSASASCKLSRQGSHTGRSKLHLVHGQNPILPRRIRLRQTEQ